jgi:hypothetical protein
MKKWEQELNKEFSKEESKMASKYRKCSTSLAIKEMQIKATLRFYLTPVKMTIIKGNNNNKCGENVLKQEPLLLVAMHVSTTTMESSMGIPQKTRDQTVI